MFRRVHRQVLYMLGICSIVVLVSLVSIREAGRATAPGDATATGGNSGTRDSVSSTIETPSFKTMDVETLKRVVGAGPKPGTFKGPTEPPPGR